MYAAYGALIGGGIAAAVDAVVLSREQVAAPPRVAPQVGFTALPGGGGFSLVGRFW